ncbi:hypothetical protein A9K55_003155 [Cordyceps militaris]|uniref:Uncharacterized protein n=1 Tax=Cordyceps militaris TaxID=73501 RepID=A0A2H4S8Z2_CORMI|nr:hypothetical protein A9K55_003155 [Cordyceps militaris]
MSDSHTPDNNPSPEDLAISVGEVALSSYSPAALTHLPQPRPADLPPDLDSSVFTFQDAFEDLLAVSQGNSLPDINARYQHSRMLRQMYPYGEPTWLWINRLQSQGLIRPPRGSHIIRASRTGWDELQKGLEQGAEELWRGFGDDPKSRDAVAEAGNIFRELLNQFSGAVNSASSSRDEQSNKNGEPGHFDDLYSAVKSTYADGQGAWDAFKKTINEDALRRINEFERQMEHKFKENKPPASTEKTFDQNEKETRSEWVDVFGYKHTTVKRKTYDDNGKETSSFTSTTIRPAEHNGADAVDNSHSNTDAVNKKNKGWFW